jgi:nickel transport protein
MKRMNLMPSIRALIRSLGLVILTAATCWSHGVDGYIEEISGCCVTARYDDGEPMSYAKVEISAPDSEIGFQSGRTDRNGRFMFLPEVQGKWNVVVTDGMGHRLALPLEFDPAGSSGGKKDTVDSAPARPPSRAVRIIDGLCIIFGFCGVLYGWKARRGGR